MTAHTATYPKETLSLLDIIMTPLQRRNRRILLDLRDLPDHLKRDIGVLDGNSIGDRRQ